MEMYLVLMGFYWVFTGFYWVLLGLLGFTGFYWVLLGFTGFNQLLTGFTGFLLDKIRKWVAGGKKIDFTSAKRRRPSCFFLSSIVLIYFVFFCL